MGMLDGSILLLVCFKELHDSNRKIGHHVYFDYRAPSPLMLRNRKNYSRITSVFSDPAEFLISSDTGISHGLQMVLPFSDGLGERGRYISASFLLVYK